MIRHIDKFDTSDFEPDNQHGVPLRNKKKLGCFKDENGGKVMTHFIGLRAKLYCTKVENGNSMKKCKGVKKYVLKKSITFDDYYRCITENCIIRRSQNTIRSKNHRLFTIRQNKIALSGFDNKRHILPNNIDTLPFGHYSI